MPILIVGGALLGAGIDYISQVANNFNGNGGDLGSALTTNIDVGSIASSALTGAVAGLAVGVLAPVAVAAVGQGMMGVGLMTGSTAVFSAGVATSQAATTLGANIYGLSAKGNTNPLSGIRYSEKVKAQATLNDYHGFPEHVDAFGADGAVYTQAGGDGTLFKHVEIEGGYKNAEGIFHYIIDCNGVCNHRVFEPK